MTVALNIVHQTSGMSCIFLLLFDHLLYRYSMLILFVLITCHVGNNNKIKGKFFTRRLIDLAVRNICHPASSFYVNGGGGDGGNGGRSTLAS